MKQVLKDIIHTARQMREAESLAWDAPIYLPSTTADWLGVSELETLAKRNIIPRPALASTPIVAGQL